MQVLVSAGSMKGGRVMPAAATAHEFSLSPGGPLDRAFARAGLQGAQPLQLAWRALLPALVFWAPLAMLAWLRPAADDAVTVGFFQDLSTHVRFLVFVPLLILVEASIGRRTRLVAVQFAEAKLIAPPDRARFEALFRRASRAIDATLAEAIIAVLAMTFVWSAVRSLESDGMMFWSEEAGPSGVRLSAAGWWYAIGSVLPPFLLMRWAWRYLIWCWLLYRLSRLDLQLAATHPDLAGGLGFVSFGHTAFAGIALAVSCLVAGAVGTRILYEGAALTTYRWPLAVYVGMAIVVGIAPLAAFWRPMRTAKESGMLAYGSFASRYAQDFHGRWIDGGSEQAPLEASGDVQGLADIGGGFERVYAMRLLPVTLKTAAAFAVAAAAPMLPLLLAVMPLRDLLKLFMQAMI
jgi:hypothetical protein